MELFIFSKYFWDQRPRVVGRKPTFRFSPDSFFVKLYRQTTKEDREVFRQVSSIFGQGPFWLFQRLALEYYLYCVAYTEKERGFLSQEEFDAAYPEEWRSEMDDPVYLYEGG